MIRLRLAGKSCLYVHNISNIHQYLEDEMTLFDEGGIMGKSIQRLLTIEPNNVKWAVLFLWLVLLFKTV